MEKIVFCDDTASTLGILDDFSSDWTFVKDIDAVFGYFFQCFSQCRHLESVSQLEDIASRFIQKDPVEFKFISFSWNFRFLILSGSLRS